MRLLAAGVVLRDADREPSPRAACDLALRLIAQAIAEIQPLDVPATGGTGR